MASGITIGGSSAFTTLPILQIVSFTTENNATLTTSSSWTSTNLSVTITPKLNTSKILVMAVTTLSLVNAADMAVATIFRGGTNLFAGVTYDAGATESNVTNGQKPMTLIAYDSPATVSATTYNVRVRRYSGTGSFVGIGDVHTMSMYAVEIAQ